MISMYTIGFTKKSAEEFFDLLKSNNIKLVYDVRLNNSNQLAGFSKGKDLKYFLKELASIDYIHDTRFSPTKEILNDYKKKKITWSEYETKFNELLNLRKVQDIVKSELSDKLNEICFLCSEEKADKCHRRLVAEKIKGILKEKDINILHI
ncbi:DUF488 domain-containing protein [Clostridium felsineum]|uniref:Uncharacterized protein n=1 Tax=Clostridium felsineum TaxID=36839 RepID=A0A1S8LYR7_9CLOT|nr:DUF488 domain-containing protein [Clostridium felsineum]URZ07526.1 hypothetical protein CLROS_028650 [Clostridium felsineum]URZ12557.1 hypothetical protein CROST_032800 [Clostridium felsineum]